MSVNAGNATNASEPYDAEETNASNDRSSPELIEERIRANLEHLNKQILTLNQLLNQMSKIIKLKLPQRLVLVVIAHRLDPQ